MFNFLAILFFASSVYCENVCKMPNKSCSFMLGKDYADDICWKEHLVLNNKSACDAAFEENAVRPNENNYGRLILNPFRNGTLTIFNVTFVNISFKVLKIGFKLYNIKDNYASFYNICMVQNFTLKDGVPTDETFSYDCAWVTAESENKYLDFFYEYGVKEYETRKKYRFWVPKWEYVKINSKELYFFTYMDYTDINNLRLNIVPAQKQFNVTQYKVEVIYTYKGQSSIKKSAYLTEDDLEYSYYTSGTVGAYHFRVEPISNYCHNDKNACIQETPIIKIYAKSLPVFGKIGVSLIIIIIMISLYKWCPQPKRKTTYVLLVTVPTNDAHVVVAPAFAKFLQETYKVNVLLDINDVPRTVTRNSFDWLKDAINHASHIIFLRSNDDLSANRVVYQDINIQTMHLLHPILNPIRKKECIISFPYSSETTRISHPELVHITNRFIFNEPCNNLMNFLFNKKVKLNRTNNSVHLDLLYAIDSVENVLPVSINQLNGFEAQLQVSDDDDDGDDYHLEILFEIPNVVNNDFDINLFGEENEELN